MRQRRSDIGLCIAGLGCTLVLLHLIRTPHDERSDASARLEGRTRTKATSPGTAVEDRARNVGSRADGEGALVPHVLARNYVGVWPLEHADIDQDGDQDVVAAASEGDEVTWWKNAGRGSWTRHTIAEGIDGPLVTEPADLDGDGDLDLVVSAYDEGDVVWFEQTPDGRWRRHHIHDRAGVISLGAVDLDGDGDLDVVAGSLKLDALDWFVNEGKARAFTRRRIDGVRGIHHVDAGDIDGDGDPDVVAAACEGDAIDWWSNDQSAATFTRHGIAEGFDCAAFVELVDMDRDRDLDVVASASDGDAVAWFENEDGGSLFARHDVTHDTDGPFGLAAVDFDEDGDVDLAVASYEGDDLSWWENRGFDTWLRHEVDPHYDGAIRVSFVDLDDDGNLDLLSAARYGNVVGYFENRPPPTAPEPHRLLVIGLDGASPRVMASMMSAGELPTFAALASRGQHGRLVPLEPILSPLLWNTAVTGVVPSRHGIDQFFVRVPGRPMSRPVPVTQRRVPALWNLASQAGRKVVVVGWWTTWPAETINGAMVSQSWTWGHDRVAATHPPEIVERLETTALRAAPAEELSKLIHGSPRIRCEPGSPNDRFHLVDGDVLARRERFLCEALRTDLISADVSVDLFRRESPDLAMVYLRGIDPTSHRYWKASFPEEVKYATPPSTEEVARYGGTVRAYYRLTDRLVARLVEAMPGANVVVLSDHGFHADPNCGGFSFEHNRLLADLGVLRLDAGDIDLSRSQVLHTVVGTRSNEGAYFVNLRSRAAEGSVGDAAFAPIVEELATRLRGLETTSGTKLFEIVETDLSAPAGRDGPDLRVVPNPEVTVNQRLVLGDGRTVPLSRYLVELDISGNHDRAAADVPGILFAAGPDIPQRDRPLDARLLDVAPTLACLADVPLAVRPDGRPIPSLIDDEVRARCARHGVPTAETVANPVALDRSPSRDRRGTNIADDLRALGYVQ